MVTWKIHDGWDGRRVERLKQKLKRAEMGRVVL
jgi:hypothetical protein